ncbi:hypothetical protein [Xanthomonas phage Fontebon]|nr:hypothetical protein [Xanthomonas phage Usaquen]QTZ82638.1 hypothetical protein [Xanthomonas phage Fontebon]CAA2366780.1 hypothetical protein [Xylella phage Usme]
MSREASLEAALERLLEVTDHPPSRNCSCHLSPPCNDCTDWGGLREAIADAETAMAMPKDPITPDQVKRAAAAIANARGGRRGVPAITNVLDILPPHLLAEVTEDAQAALEAAGGAP